MDEKLYYYQPIGKVYRIATSCTETKGMDFTSHSGVPIGNIVVADTSVGAEAVLKAYCYYPEENLSASLMRHDHRMENYIKCAGLLLAAS